jgi:O-glycosyl hydrolase
VCGLYFGEKPKGRHIKDSLINPFGLDKIAVQQHREKYGKRDKQGYGQPHIQKTVADCDKESPVLHEFSEIIQADPDNFAGDNILETHLYGAKKRIYPENRK